MQWTERIKFKRVAKWAILVLSIAIIIFSIVTAYGLSVGNFIISVKDLNDRGDVLLLLSQHADLSSATPIVSAQGLREQADSTYSALPNAEELAKNIGSHNDEVFKRYMAFSFFLLNRSTHMIDFTYEFNIRSDKSSLSEVIRVWIIESLVSGEVTNQTVYARSEPTEELERQYLDAIGNERYDTTDFVSEDTVARQTRMNFAEDTAVKFTVVIWLEGHDPLCNNDLIGATLKCSMDFMAE